MRPVEQCENRRPLSFVGIGETLFDVFEDGARTLGGAPLNVAVHAHQLASAVDIGSGIVVSRVGNDGSGDEILKLLESRQMATGYVQRDRVHPTGTVSVWMRGEEPGYQIEAGAAWDFIEPDEQLDQLASRCDAICFGCLAQRSEVSRNTIQQFLQAAPNAVRLFDVNLRRNTLTQEPGYSLEVIEEGCRLATMMKLNCAELEELCALAGLPAEAGESDEAIGARVESVMTRFGINTVVLTLGAKGTVLFADDTSYRGHYAPAPLTDVHPVGAGDACSAGILFGRVLGWHPDDSVNLANRMGAWVASQQSATPALPDSIVGPLSERIRRDRAIAGERG